MRYVVVDEGFVCRLAPFARGTDIAVGPRLVLTDRGELVCSFMRTSKTATNDFVPVLCRSFDAGKTWTEPVAVWPEAAARHSHFVNVSRDASGRMYLAGARCPIESVGEPNWSSVTNGLKANEMIVAVSDDDGRGWSEPSVIPMPIPGSAETPGPLLVLRSGRWVLPYAPYPTFDPALTVDRSQVVLVYSDDRGRTWRHTTMLRFRDPKSNGAEAWVVELADGRLLGTAWQVPDSGPDAPNAYAISRDGGTTWSPTASTGTLGQTTALAATPDNRALFLYNQRKHGDPGVRMAVSRPTETSFGIEHDDYVWRAETRTQSNSTGGHSEWNDFSFGEPGIVRLPDGAWLIALWCIQPSGTGIRYVTVRVEE